MVMASLSRDKMAILKKGTLEMPSDTDGIPARGKRGFRENRGIRGRKRVSPGVAKNGMRQNRAEARPLQALFSDVWRTAD